MAVAVASCGQSDPDAVDAGADTEVTSPPTTSVEMDTDQTASNDDGDPAGGDVADRAEPTTSLAEPTPGPTDDAPEVGSSDPAPPSVSYGPGDPIDVIVQLGGGEFPSDTRVGCAADRSFPLRNVIEPTYLTDAGRTDLLDGIVRSAAEFGIDEAAVAAIADSWVLLEESDDEALVYSPQGQGASQLSLQRTDVGWSFAGSSSGGGACDLLVQLPDGLGGVEWSVDPDELPDPSASDVAIVATELACSGSRQMGDQLLGPHVIETETEVLISFAVIPLSGPQECPGNPSTPVTIELGSPLDDRTLREGRSTGLTLDALVAR